MRRICCSTVSIFIEKFEKKEHFGDNKLKICVKLPLCQIKETLEIFVLVDIIFKITFAVILVYFIFIV